MFLECAEIALSDDFAERVEMGCELRGFRPGEESLTWEPAKTDVGSHEICEDLSPVGIVLPMAKIVGCLESEL